MVVCVEIGSKPIPKTLEGDLIQVRDRVNELIRNYKSLSNWGRPYLYNINEVATIYYVNEILGVSLDRLANFIGVDKTSLYKLIQRIKTENKVSIYNPESKKVEVINVRPEDLINIVNERLEVKSKEKITDPFMSSIIKKFWESDVEKRSKIAGKPSLLTIRHKKEVMRVVQRLMNYFNEKGLPSNPDLWEEKEVEKALWEVYKEYPKVAEAMILLRRIPEWSTWFKGRIGAKTKRINPVSRVIFYKDYLRLREMYQKGELGESEFLTIWLHLTIGCREGFATVSPSEDLDNAKSSLVSLKWDNLTKVEDTYIIKVYESKTEKYWECDLSWLDPSVLPTFMKYAKPSGSIIKTITKLNTVGEFANWYRKVLEEVSKMLGLPYRLKPHDIRRSHLSILAELGVPLEIACSGSMSFGVGWEDLKTAYIFYLRFSKHLRSKILTTIRERQKEIA
jgi:hypothetical protein